MSTTTDYEILTPTARVRVRRWVYWIVAFTAVLAIAVIGLLVKGSAELGQSLDATNPGPGGAKAVVEVLRQQGVDVTVTSTLADTRKAVTDPAATTLFVYDRDFILDDAGNDAVAELADTLVLLDPNYQQLDAAAPSVAMAGTVDGTVSADCDVFAATQAGEIASDGSGYRIVDDSVAAEGCFVTDDDIYSLVRIENPARTLSILGTTTALSNEFIGDRGNAALALNLLGENETLVWYIPGIGDLLGDSAPTLGELSPQWVTPAILLVLLGGITAAVWRGRRFGPLVIENLPVIVRSSETMQGRARLYQSNSTRLHALDALRIGTLARVGAACGLPRAASVDDVIAAVANVTGRDIQSVRSLLLDTDPRTDRELVSLSDDLLELERDVHTRLNPS